MDNLLIQSRYSTKYHTICEGKNRERERQNGGKQIVCEYCLLDQFDTRDTRSCTKKRKGEKCYFLWKSDVKGYVLRGKREREKIVQSLTPHKRKTAMKHVNERNTKIRTGKTQEEADCVLSSR